MMLKNLKLLVAGALLAASSAQATVYTYKYTAVIDSIVKKEELDYEGPVDVTSTNLLYGYTVQLGNVVQGQFTLDTAATLGTGTSTTGTYWGQYLTAYAEFPSGYGYGAKGFSEYGGGEVNITNAPSNDNVAVNFSWFGSGTGHSLTLNFADPSGSALTSTQMPSPLNFAALPDATFSYYYGTYSYSTNVWISGHITAVQVDGLAPVPEPATYGMLLAGLGLLGVVTRHRRCRLVPARLRSAH